MSGDHGRRGFAPGAGVQSDGRPSWWHLVTALVSIAATLGVGHFSAILQGKQGPPGTDTVITKVAQDYGVCAFFGPDKNGRTRLQLAAPVADASGSYCKKGTLISVVPGRP